MSDCANVHVGVVEDCRSDDIPAGLSMWFAKSTDMIGVRDFKHRNPKTLDIQWDIPGSMAFRVSLVTE